MVEHDVPRRSPANWLRRLRLGHVQLLQELSRQPSLTAVAEALHMTQPAVSQQLSELEAALGAKLFERKRGLQRTPFGDAALRWAARTLAGAERLDEEFAAMSSGATGLVRMGVMLVAAIDLVPRAISALSRSDDRLHVVLHEDIMQGLWARLTAGELDLVVGRIDDRVRGSSLVHETLYDDRHCIAVRPGHPLLAAGDLQWADTLEYRWVLPPDSTTLRQAIASTFAGHDLPAPRPHVESTSLAATQSILRSTDYIGVMSGTAGRRARADGVLQVLPLELTAHELPVGLIWHERRPSAAVVRMAEALRQAARDLRNAEPGQQAAGRQSAA
jgi:DNA-binding transcriptional LysR family regulator